MKQTTSIYRTDLQRETVAKIDSILSKMPYSCAIDTLNWHEQYPQAPATTVTLAHTCDTLFVRFKVLGEVPWVTKTKDLEHVNEDACVEMFIADADNSHYWNFEFNATGVCNASYRKSRKEDVVRLNAEQLQSIQRYAQSLIVDNQSLPRGEREESSWSLLVAIPFELIELDLSREHVRRANFYKCGDKTSRPHYASWNPINAPSPAFHLPEYFGEIHFNS